MARQHTYINLTSDEEVIVKDFLNNGKHLSREITRGRILLLNHEGKKLSEIADLLNLNYVSVTQIINRYKSRGLMNTLHDASRSGAPRKITERVEAQITALACSKEPEGQVRWTLELLHDKFIQLNESEPVVESLSKESVRTVLKKVNSNLGALRNGASKP